ncbi:MAG: PQQ-binding-like beta-propeller repeat protein [Planctomycetota bacterium]|nr:PQQ-binding-like beta-propeller repeat protein [Planctomycetota bacterium]
MDADGDAKLDKTEAADLNLTRVWFLYDMNQDEVLDEEEWGYALARATAQNGLHAIQLGGEGNLSESAIQWTWNRSLPNVPSPILVDDVLFVLKEGGVMTALNPADGETYSSGRVEGAEDSYFASPIAAGGELLLASHNGTVARMSAAAEWEVLETADFEEEIWATPALAEEGLYLRTQAALYAFGFSEEDEDE